MRQWEGVRWRQWFEEHAQRRSAEEERSRRAAAEGRRRVEQERQRLGIAKDDHEGLAELRRADRVEHPERDLLRQEWQRRRAVRAQRVQTYPLLPLRHHADLAPADGEHHELVSVGFGPAGQALAVWQRKGGQATEVSYHSPDGRPGQSTPLPAQPRRNAVQPLPGGQVLLVSARCRRGEHNAAVYDEAGQLVRSAHLGDGIEHVLSTPTGAVWTGYFDEGVFAMSGVSTHGLVRFGADLSPQWLHPLPAGPELPAVDDCSALNVHGERAWMCAYASFHLVSVEGQRARDHGQVPFSGAHALLIDGARAAMVGGYDGERHAITPLQLSSEGLRLAGPPRRLVLPDGSPVPAARYSARGAQLHVAVGACWYRLDLEDITSG